MLDSVRSYNMVLCCYCCCNRIRWCGVIAIAVGLIYAVHTCLLDEQSAGSLLAHGRKRGSNVLKKLKKEQKQTRKGKRSEVKQCARRTLSRILFIQSTRSTSESVYHGGRKSVTSFSTCPANMATPQRLGKARRYQPHAQTNHESVLSIIIRCKPCHTPLQQEH